MNYEFYNKLLRIPLFQGLGRVELEELVAQTKLHFLHIDAGKPIVRENDPCHSLLLLLEGEVLIEKQASGGSYRLAEWFAAPMALEPERLFGLSQCFSRTISAGEPCTLLAIRKNELMRIYGQHLVFRINLLNLLSTQAEKQSRRVWHPQSASLRHRFATFLLQRCTYPAGPKHLKIKMTTLARELGDSRLHVSQMLHTLEAEGHLTLHRGGFKIEKLENLVKR